MIGRGSGGEGERGKFKICLSRGGKLVVFFILEGKEREREREGGRRTCHFRQLGLKEGIFSLAEEGVVNM